MNQKNVIAILGVVVVILIGTTVYFATIKKASQSVTPTPKVVQQPTTPAQQQTNQQTQPQQPQTKQLDNTAGLTYKDDDYGFILTMPSRWQGYAVQKEGDRRIANGAISLAKSITFSLKISEPSARDDGATDYTSPIFTIHVFTKDEWKKINPNEPPGYIFIKESKIDRGTNDDFVFAYNMGQDDAGFSGFPEPSPSEEIYKGPFYDLQNVIIPSFKLGVVN